jgi:UDP-glucose 4-epimerase
MNLGITGATGFIGSYLVDFLMRQSGLRVKALARTLPRDADSVGGRVAWIKGDLNSSADCVDFVRDLDVVIHLAHTNTPLTSNRDFAADALANLAPSLNLLTAIKQAGLRPHLIYSSSGGAAYGLANRSGQQPFKETDPCLPSTSYGILKLSFESYLRMAADEGWVQATALRIGNPYGVLLPPERMQGLIGVALHQVLSGQSIRIFGDPANVRDYVHLDDVCRFFQRIMEAPGPFQIYNVGSGRGHSVNEILALLETITGRKVAREISHYPGSDKHLVPWIVLSVEKAANELGWTPETDLEEGLRALYHQSCP